MPKSKDARSWKKLMRQREAERNRFGAVHQAYGANLDAEAYLDVKNDEFDFEEEAEEDHHYLWAESIRDLGVG